jgi:hypothetical protein
MNKPSSQKQRVEPDGFRLIGYWVETGETVFAFKLPEAGILSVNSTWQPSSPLSFGTPHCRQLIIENTSGVTVTRA